MAVGVKKRTISNIINSLLQAKNHLNSDNLLSLLKMGTINYLDTILAPLSLFLIMGYHVYLWNIFKNNPSLTSTGADRRIRSMWVERIQQDNEKRGILAIQTLRNSQMSIILSATIAIALYTALAALTNNTYNAAHLLSTFFGTQSALLIVLKYSLVSLFLLCSFLCCSLALGCFTESNFLLSLSSDFSPGFSLAVFDRGLMLAFVGNRALCTALLLLLWMLGPVPLVLSSMALVWLLSKLDFVGKGKKEVLLL